VFTIIRRNTRVPDMLAADLDSEVQACLMGARRMAELFERFGEKTFFATLGEAVNAYLAERQMRPDGEAANAAG